MENSQKKKSKMTSKYNLSICFFTLTFLLLFCNISYAEEILPPTVNQVGAQMMPESIAPVIDVPFEIPEFRKTVFPDLTIDITKKGAKENKDITQIVNKAIDEVSRKGGGVVLIPEGKWQSGRIVLKSNVNLHIAEGAEIRFGDKVEDYSPAVFTRHEGVEVMGPGAFIYADGQENIAITGKGTIYGPALDSKMRNLAIADTVIEDVVNVNTPINERVFDGIDGRRLYVPKSISPINCKNVLIEGITLNHSIFWNVCPIYCENVIIRGITVNSVGIPSGDGIDIESCKNVLIEYCTLNNGDDCFTLKAGRAEDGLRVGKPTENVIIRYSLAQSGHGAITCGSETAGGIKNIYVHDCVFNGAERGIRFKTRRNRGGGVENVFYEKVRMIDVKEAFTWDLLGSERYVGDLAKRYPPRAIDHLTPVVKDIHVKDFVVESSQFFIRANCIPEIPLNNVLIENGTINCNTIIGSMDDVTGFTLRNLNINSQNSTIKILDGQNILFDNVKFTVSNNNVIEKINEIVQQSGR